MLGMSDREASKFRCGNCAACSMEYHNNFYYFRIDASRHERIDYNALDFEEDVEHDGMIYIQYNNSKCKGIW